MGVVFRVAGIAGLHLAIALLAGCGADRAPPARPSGEPREPDQRSAPELQGVRSDALADALERAHQRHLDIHSLTIVRHGTVVLDAAFYPFPPNTRHDVASVTKSVTSILVGIAIQMHKLSEDQPVTGRPEIRVRDLLSMQSGLDCGVVEGEGELAAMTKQADWVGFARSLRQRVPPGTQFAYCSPGYHLLSAELSRVTGMSERAFAQAYLFGPLGITDVYWPSDPQGITHGWGDLQLRPRDMAKLGELFLQHGRWHGAQIVPDAWITRSTQVHATIAGDEDYGYGWRISKPIAGMYLAYGRGGQRIVVWPSKDVVISVTAGNFDLADISDALLDALRSDVALPPNPAGQARLAAALRAISAVPPPAAPPSPASAMSGVTYRLEANALDARTVRFTAIEPNLGRIELRVGDRLFAAAVGLDGVYRTSPDPMSGALTAARGHGLDAGAGIAIDWMLFAVAEHIELQLARIDDGVVVTLREPTHLGTLTLRGSR